MLFTEILGDHGGERHADSVGSLQLRGWDSRSLHVAKSGAAGQWCQSDHVSDSRRLSAAPEQ